MKELDARDWECEEVGGGEKWSGGSERCALNKRGLEVQIIAGSETSSLRALHAVAICDHT